MSRLPLTQRNRLAHLGELTYDGSITARGYRPTPERRRFLANIDRLVSEGKIATALKLHVEQKDFRVTGRAGSWALCDHVAQGEKLRFLLGARPDRADVLEATLEAA